MRLKSVTIDHYKNLRNFTLNFDNNSFIDLFVGKNGTGKSNLFEALIKIFHHIAEYDRDKVPCDFSYRISYEIDGNTTAIDWNTGNLTIDGDERKTIGKTLKPDNLLIYYSGHNDTVSDLVEQYEGAFRKRIKQADISDTRYLIGIGSEYKELLLAMLLMQPENSKARQFICEKLGIETVASEVRLVLERPVYAADPRFDIELNDETDRYWKPEGITKTFLNRLHECISTATGSMVRSEGYFASEDRYILYFDIDAIHKEFADLTPQKLFRQFDNLKMLRMLSEITIPVQLSGTPVANIVNFSDGQFQSIYIYAIVELFKDRNCITLLDEPDCFLHPEWQFDFLTQVFEITDTTSRNNHVLMSSHSAVTLIPHDRTKIKFFDIKNNHASCYDLPKSIAIKKLSADLIKYSEQEQLLSVINTIQIENKPVLFTEGSTDPLILKAAWYKLYEDEMPFIPFYAFSSTYINQLLTDNRIHAEMNGLALFGLFDFDKAYNQWNGLNGTIIEQNPFHGKIKKWDNGESYALMIPIPKNPDIQKQVICDATTGKTFEGESCCEIEHLFYGQTATKDYYHKEPCVGGNKIVFKSDRDKTTFAKKVVPTLDSTCFDIFRPMFEFIKSKCPTVSE